MATSDGDQRVLRLYDPRQKHIGDVEVETIVRIIAGLLLISRALSHFEIFAK